MVFYQKSSQILDYEQSDEFIGFTMSVITFLRSITVNLSFKLRGFWYQIASFALGWGR